MLHVELAPAELKPTLRQLLTACLEEFTLASGYPREQNADGLPSYPYFDLYWEEPARLPFALRLEDTVIGFCFLRDTGSEWQVAEFYIHPSYRRRGLGTTAVIALKNYCRAQRRHRTLEARTLLWNAAAHEFWISQGFKTVAADAEVLHNLFWLSV